jgi:hypothetical protein
MTVRSSGEAGPAREHDSLSVIAQSELEAQRSTFVLPHAARTWLVIALVLFFASALAALLTNGPADLQGLCNKSPPGDSNPQPLHYK